MKLWKMFYTMSGNIVVMAEDMDDARYVAELYMEEIANRSELNFFSTSEVANYQQLPSGFHEDSIVYAHDMDGLTVEKAMEQIREIRAQEEFEARQLNLFKAS